MSSNMRRAAMQNGRSSVCVRLFECVCVLWRLHLMWTFCVFLFFKIFKSDIDALVSGGNFTVGICLVLLVSRGGVRLLGVNKSM